MNLEETQVNSKKAYGTIIIQNEFEKDRGRAKVVPRDVLSPGHLEIFWVLRIK